MSEQQSNNEDAKKTDKVEVEVDPFTRMMFGRTVQREPEVKEETSSQKKIGEDYYALIEQVDSIMDSVNKLKPMLKEFSPILEYFKKK